MNHIFSKTTFIAFLTTIISFAFSNFSNAITANVKFVPGTAFTGYACENKDYQWHCSKTMAVGSDYNLGNVSTGRFICIHINGIPGIKIFEPRNYFFFVTENANADITIDMWGAIFSPKYTINGPASFKQISYFRDCGAPY